MYSLYRSSQQATEQAAKPDNMTVQDNITAVRGDVPTHSQNFFIYFFTKFPAYQDLFLTFKGKTPQELRDQQGFRDHAAKVVGEVLLVAERASDSEKLKEDARKVIAMTQHRKLTLQHYIDLFSALVPFLESQLGASCDTAGWQAIGAGLVGALKEAGLQ